MPSPVASVIVTYNPPPGFAERVRSALAQTDLAVIVDNASQRPPELPDGGDRERTVLLRNSENEGIAAALNQGIVHAASLGAAYALLLDHDSMLQPGAVNALRSVFDTATTPPIAAAVPRIIYAHPDIACRWPRSNGSRSPFFRFVYAARQESPIEVDLAISSGMLVRIETFRELGGFDASLFIDLVDTDYCLRARRQGYSIVAVPDAVLLHELGQVEKRMLLGLIPTYPTNHNADRHYTISRNRITLAKRHALRFPAWMVYETLGAAKLTIKVALFEQARAGKLRSMLRGTRDGMTRTASSPSPSPRSGTS